MYTYGTTVMAAADQYLDNATATVAKRCGYEMWPHMVMCYFASICIQAVLPCLMWVYWNCGRGLDLPGASYAFIGLLVLAGINSEAASVSFQRESHEDSWRDPMLVTLAALAISRFFTECLPQAWFAIDFASSHKGEASAYMAYVSSGFSLAVAGYSCITAVKMIRERTCVKQCEV